MIEIEHLNKTYPSPGGDIHALRDVDLRIEDGEIFGIIGLSGAGKSTLVRCINLLERPTSGTVRIDGRDMTQLSRHDLLKARQDIGMIFQSFNLLEQRTVLRNICFPLEIAGVKRDEAQARAAELLELVGLSDRAKNYPSQLSGGQKQRVAIARALSTEPRVLLCDEATSALDPETTDSILGLIRDINKRLGITAVVITHEMDVIEKICSKVAIISKGVIAETGTVNEVFFHPRSEIARRLVVPEALHPDKMKLPKLYRLIFDGQSSFDPVVSNMVLACGKPVNIMYASTQDIGGTAFGQMVLQLPEDEESIARIQAYVKEHGLYLEEFTHA